MNIRTGVRAIVGAVLLGIAGNALATTVAKEASIPFANHGGIRDWAADDDRGLWLQDVHRNWYYARLMGPCVGLRFTETLGFDTGPLGRFDKFSAIVVPGGHRCVVQSFTPSEGPRSAEEAGAKS
ncbi:MAG TPA: DUF6491 family protein [Steroidobacteraceae bacterium]